MFRMIQVRLREAGQISYYGIGDIDIQSGDYCIVQAERGLEYGQAVSDIEEVLDGDIEQPLRKVERPATEEDVRQINENNKKAEEVFSTGLKKIEEHKVPMKLVECEYTFDRSKIIFYFTAEERVDFRNLVKDLAAIFRARIELKQIGVRDEARMLGGFGSCGRELCCVKFLKDFEPVSIKMAKEQNLPLNPGKISGLCGRLMCCLGYEACTYREFCKKLPKMGQTVETKQGKAKIVGRNIIKQALSVESESGAQFEVLVDDLLKKHQKNKTWDKDKNE